MTVTEMPPTDPGGESVWDRVLWGVDPCSLSVDDQAGELEALASVVSVAQARMLEVTGAFDAANAARDLGADTTRSWLAFTCSMSSPAAGAVVRDARRLRDHPQVADAMPSIGAERTRVVLRGATPRTREAFARDAARLCADAGGMTVDETIVMMQAWLAYATADGTEPGDDLGRLSCSRVGDRLAITGSGEGADATFFEHALDAMAERLWREEQGCDDGRRPTTPAQRRWNALIAITRLGVDADPRLSNPSKPHVHVLLPVDTLLGLSPHGAEIIGQGPITAAEALRLACDAGISRLITGPKGTILDQGRTRRKATPTQRLAVIARDKHCAVPGCTARPERCDTHHTTHWENGGLTNIDDLVLICWAHHFMHHTGIITITRTPDGTLTFHKRDGTPIRPRPPTP